MDDDATIKKITAALKVAGITNAKEFAATLAAVTLGGKYNFATLHNKERMYTGR